MPERCQRGHPLTPENVIERPCRPGRYQCRPCFNLRARGVAGPPRFCRKGLHEWVPENIFVYGVKRPRRACEPCYVDARLAYQERRAS